MKKFFLLILSITTIPIYVNAEKMTNSEKESFSEGILNQCTSEMYKPENQRIFKAMQEMLKESNISDPEDLLKSAFKVYCGCLEGAVFINLDKEEILPYTKKTCVPLLLKNLKAQIKAEQYLKKKNIKIESNLKLNKQKEPLIYEESALCKSLKAVGLAKSNEDCNRFSESQGKKKNSLNNWFKKNILRKNQLN